MEGPSLVILREELAPFRGKNVLKAAGNSQLPKEDLDGRTLDQISTWGKVLFLTFGSPNKGVAPIVTKTHFLMFGSYRINNPKPDRDPRLELRFRNGVVYFYSCSLKFGAEEDLELLDPRVDLMSRSWDEKYVLELLEKKRDVHLCDLFLDQNIFAGSGNIVKNEVLFNIRRHPLTKLCHVGKNDRLKLVQAVHEYCWNFYLWKKNYVLRKHWQVYRQLVCPLCGDKLVKENLGRFHRKSFYCARHQLLPARASKLTVHPVLPMQGPPTIEPRVDH